MLNFEPLKVADKKTSPFTYISASNIISQEDAALVRDDYPDISKSGYLPLSQLNVQGHFKKIIDDLQSTQLAEILSDRLDIDLTEKPRMITVRKLSKHGDGRIHNDSVSKICTMLLYLNADWDDAQGGAIRALNGPDNMDDFAEEVTPIAGNVFAFARDENSWHGHPSFAGERYVIQVTFLINEEELQRKEGRGKLQLFLKKINPFTR